MSVLLDSVKDSSSGRNQCLKAVSFEFLNYSVLSEDSSVESIGVSTTSKFCSYGILLVSSRVISWLCSSTSVSRSGRFESVPGNDNKLVFLTRAVTSLFMISLRFLSWGVCEIVSSVVS
jgi:hypothetical protein